MRRILQVSLLVTVSMTLLWGAKAISLSSDFAPAAYLPLPAGPGITHDGNPDYADRTEGVRNYFGVNGRNVVLHTYNTTRRLKFTFDPGATAAQEAGLTTVTEQVNLYGVNYYGPFVSMGVGTTAQVKTTLEFYVPAKGNTYYLEYPALAAKRLSQSEWLLTSEPDDIGGYPGFWASDMAELGVFRRKQRDAFGTVNMPIRFVVTIQ